MLKKLEERKVRHLQYLFNDYTQRSDHKSGKKKWKYLKLIAKIRQKTLLSNYK